MQEAYGPTKPAVTFRSRDNSSSTAGAAQEECGSPVQEASLRGWGNRNSTAGAMQEGYASAAKQGYASESPEVTLTGCGNSSSTAGAGQEAYGSAACGASQRGSGNTKQGSQQDVCGLTAVCGAAQGRCGNTNRTAGSQQAVRELTAMCGAALSCAERQEVLSVLQQVNRDLGEAIMSWQVGYGPLCQNSCVLHHGRGNGVSGKWQGAKLKCYARANSSAPPYHQVHGYFSGYACRQMNALSLLPVSRVPAAPQQRCLPVHQVCSRDSGSGPFVTKVQGRSSKYTQLCLLTRLLAHCA